MLGSELGRKWYLADAVVKIRRRWSLAFGSGMGLGMVYSNYQCDFPTPYLLHVKCVKVQ
ncbi:PREDICTED: mitochondrial inner membrane organizing system protein 1-like [Chrysochloris asiatica]|uniref:Mitochondrial inner membrane organizing system protein 1-like n=1 Tax=Chrysochloris asiatica TaxID=185453 RepID=A0A9B0T396_CHRAS|nr:PREDICTED: mitochondrial inner membrane organizing system protein 1-like [Chrysochloris asiatica]